MPSSTPPRPGPRRRRNSSSPLVTTNLGRIKDALAIQRDKYQKASGQEKRREIADTMDKLAELGMKIAEPWMDPGKPKFKKIGKVQE